MQRGAFCGPSLYPAFRSSESSRDGKATGHGAEAKQYRKYDIADGKCCFAISGQRQRLQAEGRYRGVATEKPGYGEQPGVRRCKQRTTAGRKRAENADQESSRDVDDHRAPRKSFAEAPCHGARDEISRGTAERAANDDANQCAYHGRNSSMALSSPALRYRPESMPLTIIRRRVCQGRPAWRAGPRATPARMPDRPGMSLPGHERPTAHRQ